MPTLIRWTGQRAELAEDPFTAVGDEDPTPQGDVIVSLQRFQAEGQRLLAEGRKVGVRIEPHEDVEELEKDLPRLAVVALAFPKFLHGQAYSSARILRERYGFEGELRAVGEVLREQARFMVRCGIDAFQTADGSTPDQWTHVVTRFRHVYQRAGDGLAPAFAERADAGARHGV
ncbi:MAG TPA: DUF934 domain-containing protein [Caulobacteraceae bacterium]|nr:DUF934 domain-containing protein [Caulobacteraceae bacterium]